MQETTINKSRRVVFEAIELTTGITDWVVTLTKPDGTTSSIVPTVAEIANGLYEFSYTPDEEGVWLERVQSTANSMNVVQSVKVVLVDNTDLKQDTVSIKTKQVEVENKVDNVQTTVNTVDGKVDGVQNTANDINSKIDTLDSKVDNIQFPKGGRFV